MFLILKLAFLLLLLLLLILLFHAENVTVEELNLADNAKLDKQLALRYDSTENMNIEVLQPKLNTSELSVKRCMTKEADPDQQGLCQMNTDYNHLEVADSEDLDNQNRVENAASAFDDSCTSSCQKNPSLECQFIQELSTAIGMAKQLQQLDLSNNGFSTQAAETLYSAWSSRLGAAPAWKHIKNHTIHLSVEENKCCRVKPCCRRN